MTDSEVPSPPQEDIRWKELLRAAVVVSGAAAGLLLVHDGKVWRKAVLDPPEDPELRGSGLDAALTAALGSGTRGPAASPVGQPLWVEGFPGLPDAALVLRGSGGWSGPPAAARPVLGLLAELPGLKRRAAPAERLGGRLENMALVLDLMVLVSGVDGFREALLKVVNEVAARCGCQRVSVGWRRGGISRVRAVSHAEKVDRRSGLIGLIESAMEECAEQDTEIILPTPADDPAAVRDHQSLAAETRNTGTASLPLRENGRVVGVLTVERESAWTAEQLAALRLTADLLGPVLAGMERRSRWLGSRAWHQCREWAGTLVGHRHTGWKLLALAALASLAVLFLGGMTYKVEATFMVESDSVAMVTAPFDGFLDQVSIRVGDEVETGGPLFSLDTRELVLEESEAFAEWRHQRAAAMKAEGEGELADMKIAEAAAAQAEARLEMVRYRLGQASATAPFRAVVIEGDLRERLGAPLRQGDVMVKLVKLDDLYLSLSIDERDIAEVAAGGGEVAFTADPSRRFAFRIERVEPAASARDEGNVFPARAVVEQGAPPWWRPGMGGVAKIHVGRRSFWWILTHRTTDFLRMKLWW